MGAGTTAVIAHGAVTLYLIWKLVRISKQKAGIEKDLDSANATINILRSRQRVDDDDIDGLFDDLIR